VVVALSSEFIENAAARDLKGRSAEDIKQDWERKALVRLLPRIKKDSPQLAFVLALERLYACGPVFALPRVPPSPAARKALRLRPRAAEPGAYPPRLVGPGGRGGALPGPLPSFRTLCLAISAYSQFRSHPTAYRPSLRAVARVVPLPQNGSKTTPCWGAPARMQVLAKSVGKRAWWSAVGPRPPARPFDGVAGILQTVRRAGPVPASKKYRPDRVSRKTCW
jgi:hypothetical protein